MASHGSMAGRFSPSQWGLLGTSQHCCYGLHVIVECVFRGVDVFFFLGHCWGDFGSQFLLDVFVHLMFLLGWCQDLF